MPTTHYVSRKWLRKNGLELGWKNSIGNIAEGGKDGSASHAIEWVGDNHRQLLSTEQSSLHGDTPKVNIQAVEQKEDSTATQITLNDDDYVQPSLSEWHSSPGDEGLIKTRIPIPGPTTEESKNFIGDTKKRKRKTADRSNKVSFSDRIEALKVYKEKHGHLIVSRKEDQSLADFCSNIRFSRKNPGMGVRSLTEDRIASLDAIGFEWERKNGHSFEKRLGALRAFKEKYGHVNVGISDDKNLAKFCSIMRFARRNPGSGSELNEERISLLDALGFDWEKEEQKQKVNVPRRRAVPFADRLAALKAHKAKYGHLKVSRKEDQSLADFIRNARQARKGNLKLSLSESEIASLDAIGFQWVPEKTVSEGSMISNESFKMRLEELFAYKERNGHLNVQRSEDKDLVSFCQAIRSARKNQTLAEDRIASLDAIGFEWAKTERAFKSFDERLDELKSYKEKHGHLHVQRSDDKRLHAYCAHMRSAYNGKGKMRLERDQIASLDAIGFKWRLRQPTGNNDQGENGNHRKGIFIKWIEELKQYRSKHGHVNVTEKDNRSLCFFCRRIRYTRNNPEKSTSSLNQAQIDALDEIGFNWDVGGNSISFCGRVAALKAYKEKHGHLLVDRKEEKSLADFCANIRTARRNLGKPGHMKLTDERIASLDAIGFDWTTGARGPHNSKRFEERVEDLRAYKEKNGHLDVQKKEDSSLFHFCANIRNARRYLGKPGYMVLTEERIASLDAIGFDWTTAKQGPHAPKPFEERVEDLRAYNEKNGHLNVQKDEDSGLFHFCSNIRKARRHLGKPGFIMLNDERIASLDALGFDWAQSARNRKSFEERLEELRSYRDIYGHLNVKSNEGKGLAQYCSNLRAAWKRGKLSDTQQSSLDAIGFPWYPPTTKPDACTIDEEALDFAYIV